MHKGNRGDSDQTRERKNTLPIAKFQVLKTEVGLELSLQAAVFMQINSPGVPTHYTLPTAVSEEPTEALSIEAIWHKKESG